MVDSNLTTALAAVSEGNLTTGLAFALEAALRSNDPAQAYNPTLIQAAAAAKDSEALEASEALKKKYGADIPMHKAGRWWVSVREVKAELSRVASEERPAGLITGHNGNPLIGLENAMIYFQSAKEWKNVLGYNEFTGAIELRKLPPSPISQKLGEEIEDTFDTDATRWLERKSQLMFRPEITHRVLDLLARQNRFHPVRDYLSTLPVWDGTERISEWLTTYCGVKPGSDTAPSIAGSFGRKFLISLVARVMRPGCKADHMLVLEGKTGIGKSSIAKALMPQEEWFTDQVDMESKDAPQKTRGVWLIEFADLDGFSRADEKTAKRFISQQTERFRMPYGKRLTTFPRQCAFIGTTERSDWMRSETGRRFWPVRCGRVNLSGLIKDRDQLWAEALMAFNRKESWHLTDSGEISDATSEQRKRYSEDPWHDHVLEVCESLLLADDWVTIQLILEKMQVPVSQRDDRSAKRIGAVLRFEGWERVQRRKRGTNPAWGYKKPEDESDS